MVFCPSCGAEKKEGSKFCHNCGYEFKTAGSEANQNTNDNVQFNQSAGSTVPQNQNSHTVPKILGYIFAILIPLIGLIFGIYLWFCDETDAKKHGKIIIGIAVIIWALSFIFMSAY